MTRVSPWPWSDMVSMWPWSHVEHRAVPAGSGLVCTSAPMSRWRLVLQRETATVTVREFVSSVVLFRGHHGARSHHRLSLVARGCP